MFRTKPYELPVLEHPCSAQSLYPHQVAMWEAWDSHTTLLLAAKTGTGKTRAAMLPVMKRRECAVAVYPTNELLRDQVRAVERFAEDERVPVFVVLPHLWDTPDRSERYSRAEHLLVPVDGSLLDQWQQVLHCRSRGETLRRLLNPDKPRIVFTNPDILFLILGLRYHAEPFGALQRYRTLIVDEFHLYHGVELAHALAMVTLARGFGMFRRLVLLSATPHPEVKELLDRTVKPVVISANAGPQKVSSKYRTAIHDVEVTPVQVVDDPVEILVEHLIGLRLEFERLRHENQDAAYLPAVVIVNSVLSAIRLEDRLVGSGFARDSLAVIRGLSHRSVRQTQGKLIALGTSAIEVGVDFHCDYLMFEALDAASFLQRFGRVGRHGSGKAVVLVPPNAFKGMTGLPAEIDRAELEERIYVWYRSAESHAWFVSTEHGMITSRALAENLAATVGRDGNARPEVLSKMRATIDTLLANYAEQLGCTIEDIKAKSAFQRCAAGKSGAQWLKAYCTLNRFRTSLPSQRVHDFMEQHRRQEWDMGEYDADLATLLKQAVGLRWNEERRMLTIRGIGKYHRVHASELFSPDHCGHVLETKDFPNLLLYQDGESTPVSDLMGRENHIFAVVAKSEIIGNTDWRVPLFESGAYLIAFDGAALWLLELARFLRDRPQSSKSLLRDQDVDREH